MNSVLNADKDLLTYSHGIEGDAKVLLVCGVSGVLEQFLEEQVIESVTNAWLQRSPHGGGNILVPTGGI